MITREFELPLELLFKAYAEPDIIEQWMGTKELKLENISMSVSNLKQQIPGKRGIRSNEIIHEFGPNDKITRTFQMEKTTFGAQLEFFKFEQLTDNASKLNLQLTFESVAQRNQVLQLPYAYGINMAHTRVQYIVSKLKKHNMTKRNKIIYWASTILIALGMLPGGIGQIFHAKWSLDLFRHLGYPVYILAVIGTWKVLGSIVLLIPKFPLTKEWAYAGFFFAMSGAVFSHIASGDTMSGISSPLVLLILIVASWYYRPADRKIIFI